MPAALKRDERKRIFNENKMIMIQREGKGIYRVGARERYQRTVMPIRSITDNPV